MKDRPLRVVKSDPQREAFYAAELEINPKRRYKMEITLAQARHVIADIRKLYDLPPCSVRRIDPPGPTFAAEMSLRYRNDGTVISGQILAYRGKYALTLQTVLHEMAHFINAKARLDGAQSHGPEFAGVFAWLYDHFRLIPQDAMRLVYRRYGIKAIPHAAAAPFAVRHKLLTYTAKRA